MTVTKASWLRLQYPLNEHGIAQCKHNIDGTSERCGQTYRAATGTGHRIEHLLKHAACKTYMQSQGWLSICASEASVERSFSLQDRIHSDWRNALRHENIINQMFIHFNAMSPNHKPVATGAWIEIEENVDPALFSESSMPVSSELQQPVVESQQPVAESPAVEPMQDDAIEDGSVETRAARVAVNERYGYIIETTDMNSLCSAWLNTEAAKRAIGASNRIKFNADLEADLDLFMRSNSCNDPLSEVKRSVRSVLRSRDHESDSSSNDR
jgi:hypothetical protein